MELIKPGTNYNFVGAMKTMAVVSLLLTVITVVLWFTVGPNYGIDFVGGAEIEITFKNKTNIAEVRKTVEELGLGNVEIKSVQHENYPNEGYIIRVERKSAHAEQGGEEKDIATIIEGALKEKFGPYEEDMFSVSVVGPRAGEELRRKAFLAVVMALVLMLIYIAVRFEVISAIGAVIALFHDVMITIGFLLIGHREFNLTTIAALLTIVGYSLNDTIVVYDRVRENKKKYRQKPFGELINASINETLSRTVLTGGTTLLAIIVLLFITAGALQDFAYAMTIGIITGTYSSIFIASAFVVLWELKIKPSLEKGKKKSYAGK